VLVCPAEIDDGLDAQLGEALPSRIGGLATTEDMFIDLMEVGDTQRLNMS
jgi:hypothetical protein